MFKKGIIWCLILAMLLGMASSAAAAGTAEAKTMVVSGQLPVEEEKHPASQAVRSRIPQAEMVQAMRQAEPVQVKGYEGTPVGKRIIRVYSQVYKNGRWQKASSITLGQYEIGLVGFTHVYSGSSSYNTLFTLEDSRIADWEELDKCVFAIMGLVPGSTKITAHERYYNKKCTLKIKVTPAKVTDLELTSAYFEVPMGSIFNLSEHVSVVPEYAANQALTYKSSNKKVATIDKNGYVTPKQFGTTTITITSKQNKKAKIYCTIAVMTPDYNPVEYRFVGIGQSDYSGTDADLPSCYNDMVMMGLAYMDSSFNGAKIKDCTGYYDCTGSRIRSILSGMASSGADENDVTVFYYSGHGAASDNASYRGALCGVDDTYITVEEVRKYLDRVPGTVIVILDCCLSGQYIESKSAAGQKGLANQYARSVISTFASSPAKNYKALTDSPYASKYKILTACQPLQISMGLRDYGVFTYWVLAGIGFDADEVDYCKMYADANNNKAVSLKELYTYVEKGVAQMRQDYAGAIDQVTMVWPMNDNTTVLAKN